MQLEKGLVILEATASMESFRESSATVTSHACVYVRSCVRICMYVHMCAYVSKVYVYSATTVMTAHPSHMFVCVSMYIRMCARWHASAFACVCDTDWSILPVFLFLVAPNVCGYALLLCLGFFWCGLRRVLRQVVLRAAQCGYRAARGCWALAWWISCPASGVRCVYVCVCARARVELYTCIHTYTLYI